MLSCKLRSNILFSDFVVARLANIETYHLADASTSNGAPSPDNNDQGVTLILDFPFYYISVNVSMHLCEGCSSGFGGWSEHEPARLRVPKENCSRLFFNLKKKN